MFSRAQAVFMPGGEFSGGFFSRSGKELNARKGNRPPHEAGLKLLSAPRAPKELPATALIRNAHGIPEWKLFVRE